MVRTICVCKTFQRTGSWGLKGVSIRRYKDVVLVHLLNEIRQLDRLLVSTKHITQYRCIHTITAHLSNRRNSLPHKQHTYLLLYVYTQYNQSSWQAKPRLIHPRNIMTSPQAATSCNVLTRLYPPEVHSVKAIKHSTDLVRMSQTVGITTTLLRAKHHVLVLVDDQVAPQGHLVVTLTANTMSSDQVSTQKNPNRD